MFSLPKLFATTPPVPNKSTIFLTHFSLDVMGAKHSGSLVYAKTGRTDREQLRPGAVSAFPVSPVQDVPTGTYCKHW